MTWKTIAILFTGILLGCAGNAARTAYAGPSVGQPQFKCMGPSSSVSGIEEDLNALAAEGFVGTLISGGIVCGRR